MIKIYYDNRECLRGLREAVIAVQNLHSLGYVHRHIQPSSFSTSKGPNGPFILHSFHYTVPQSNLEVLNDLPENKYYYKIQYQVAGHPKQDIFSLCLMIMAYEIGAVKYEEKMKSMGDKKAMIKKFVDDDRYSSEVRQLLREAIVKDTGKIGLKEIQKVAENLFLKTEYIDSPRNKRIKRVN